MITVNVVLASDETKKATIAIDPNQPVNQALLIAVEKLGLSSAVGYHLRYQRKLIGDLSMPIRFAGLPQSARVDVVHVSSLSIPELKQMSNSKSKSNTLHASSDLVTIATQLPVGRLQASFKSHATLWQILLAFESISERSFVALKIGDDSSVETPEVVLHNHKISDFKQLTQTRLVDLGITSGSYLLRVTHQKIQLSIEDLSKLIPSTESDVLVDQTLKQAPSVNNESSKPEFLDSMIDKSESAESISTTASSALAEDYDIDLLVFDAKRLEISGKPPMDVPDSFYTLNSEELKTFYASSQRSTKSIVEGRPLVTKTTQERLKTQAVLSSHPITRIRFRFPDKLCLERNFRTTDSVETLNAFVTSTVKGAPKFTLTVGPPLKILGPDETLLSLQLYPASVINVIWKVPEGASQTSIKTSEMIPGNFRSEERDHESLSKRPNSPSSISTDTETGKAKGKTSKMPKWFKVFKK